MSEPQAGRRVLVTGAAGFIGFHVTARLLDMGIPVLGVDNLNGYYDPALKHARLKELDGRAGFAFLKADLVDEVAIDKAFSEFRPTEIVHLAAQAGVRYSIENPRAYLSSNIDGFLTILEACRSHSVKHLIFASSSSVYGDSTKAPFSENDPADRPVSLYAATKRANELMAHTYAHLFGIPATSLRFFTVYGPWGRPDMAYYSFTQAIFAGREIEVFNGGRMSRDFTYVDDVVEGIVRLLDKPPQERVPYVIYNIGNHTPVELEAFISAIERAAGRPAKKIYKPMQPGDVCATYADIRHLSEAVGFHPDTSIENGIRRFVEWYKTYHGVDSAAA